MKKTIVILFLIASLVSCKSSLENLLTQNTWKVDKVINLNTGVEENAGPRYQKAWDFNPANTYQYASLIDGQRQFTTGEWELDEFTLSVITTLDTTQVKIEKITETEMVWLISGKDPVRVYLSSVPREVILPNFPKAATTENNSKPMH